MALLGSTSGEFEEPGAGPIAQQRSVWHWVSRKVSPQQVLVNCVLRSQSAVKLGILSPRSGDVAEITLAAAALG
jgi:hypothetical protein